MISATVEPLLPVRLGKGGVHYARGMLAGNWIFATGQLGQDFVNGIAPDVLAARNPQAGTPKREKEAARIFDNIAEVLAAGGGELSHIVRTDQYYTTHEAVSAYQTVRRGRFSEFIPASTSIVMNGLLLPGADIEIQALAALPDRDRRAAPFDRADLSAAPTSGYAPAVRYGDFVFCAGILANPEHGKPGVRGMSPEAVMPEGNLWRGQPIKLEADHIIGSKLKPVLELAGSSLANVVKAQIYMTHVEDFAAFSEVWAGYFPDNPPATTLVPCPKPALAVADARIEINVIALADRGATTAQIIDAGIATGYAHQSQAVRAGDLLFLSGLMAVDGDGLVEAAQFDPRQPAFQSSVVTQAETILDNAERICEAAGTSLANVVRAQQFHTDIGDFLPVYKAWERRLGGRPIPFSAVEVAGPMPAPGCSLMMDLWVYAP